MHNAHITAFALYAIEIVCNIMKLLIATIID